jgi:RNA polymerase sigma-70 factor (ECF subfamily)
MAYAAGSQSAERDEEAFAEFCDRAAPLLRGIALRIVSSAKAAEELVQDALLEFWKRPDRKNELQEGIPAALVLGIRDSSIRKLRHIRNLPPLESLERGPRLGEECLPRPSDISRVNGRHELLKILLKQLPAAQRSVLNFSLFEGYSEKEIAHLLHQPLGKVRDEVRASLEFARQRLQTLTGIWTADI